MTKKRQSVERYVGFNAVRDEEEEQDNSDELGPFAGGEAEGALTAIIRDEGEAEVMMTVLEQISRSWGRGSAPFDGSYLMESGVPVERMLRVAQELMRRRVVTVGEGVALKDQLATAGAEIEAETDPEMGRIRAMRSDMKRRAQSGEAGSGFTFDQWKALRDSETTRMVVLKLAVLRRSGERDLAAMLENDPTGYERAVEMGERSVVRLMHERAA